MTGGIPDFDRDLSETTEEKVNRKLYEWDVWKIPFLEYPADDAPGILFVHGAPGSMKAFFPYFERRELAGEYHLISVDRPGYGDAEPRHSLPSVAEQAASISPLLDEYAASYYSRRRFLPTWNEYSGSTGPVVGR